MIKKILHITAIGAMSFAIVNTAQALIINNESPERHSYIVDGQRNEGDEFLLKDHLDDLSGWGWRSTTNAIEEYNANGTIPPLQYQNITLITPKHVMAVDHWPLRSDRDYVFVGTDGKYYGSKVITDTYVRVMLPYASDLRIYELVDEIPTEFVKPIFLADANEVLGEDPAEETLYVAGREKIVGWNYFGQGSFYGDGTFKYINPLINLRWGTAGTPPDDVGVSEDNDSGSATMIVHNDRLYVVGVRRMVTYDTAVHVYYPAISDIIDNFNAVNGTDYALNQNYPDSDQEYSIADMNQDGVVNEVDIDIFVTAAQKGDLIADLDGSGSIDFFDYSIFLQAYKDAQIPNSHHQKEFEVDASSNHKSKGSALGFGDVVP